MDPPLVNVLDNTRPFRVGFVLVDGFSLMSYASAMEPLRAANVIAGHCVYDIHHMPAEGARAVSSSGAIVAADTFLGERADFELVLVVAAGDALRRQFARLDHWLKLLASRGVLIGGVSAGPLLLARAGIMEGRRMTIHWDHAQALRAVSANLSIERTLFVRDRGRLTCAGGTAAMDMMYTLIAQHHGGEFARAVGEWFIQTDMRPGGEPQAGSLSERYAVTNLVVLKALQLMENHLDDPLTLTQISDIAGIGSRQLNRLFNQHLQSSAVNFYTTVRLHKAHELLNTGLLSVKDVARATGFATGAHFSRQFSRRFGYAPSTVRTR